MKKYLITVKGISYEVEVEEIKAYEEYKAPKAPEAPEAPKAPKVQPIQMQNNKTLHSSKNDITSPMPGSIFKVMVKPGDTVKRGDVLIILEAMKMENEIFAVSDAVVKTVEVQEGVAVNTGDILITF